MRQENTKAFTQGERSGAGPGPVRKSSMIVPVGTMGRVPSAAEPSLVESPATVSDRLAGALAELGVTQAFGVFGGGIAPFCQALTRTSIRLMHTRHEGSAAFAAIEASLASGRPSVVVATTGPGLTNLYTGMVAARAEGAKVLFVSGCTPAAQRGRGAFQETGGTASALAPLFASGPLFHHAAVLEDPAELDAFLSRLSTGFAKPTGFVAHVGLPLAIQTAERARSARTRITSLPPPVSDANSVEQCLELLADEPFVIWAGFGARHAADEVKKLAELSGARVMCTPRGKGVMPEKHPLYLGVTGLGGHAEPETYVRMARPARVLVLGSRLGEMASFWSRDLVPEEGLIHVDLDPSAFGAAYPDVPTLGVQGEIGAFLRSLIASWPSRGPRSSRPAEIRSSAGPLAPRETGAVRPSFLMEAVQQHVVEKCDATVLTEAGNAFLLGTHHLRFDGPRYRVSTSFGSMGQAAAGVLGAALAGGNKAFAIVGDGAMMMNNEISTAANYGIGAVWVVLNDARYGMVEEGMRSVGWTPFETDFPRVDFVAIARAMGGDGVRVTCEAELAAALEAGRCALGPFVIDVLVDSSELAPSGKRNQSLKAQGLRSETPSFGGGR